MGYGDQVMGSTICVQFLIDSKHFSLLQNILVISWALATSYSRGTGLLSPAEKGPGGIKADHSLPLVLRLRISGAILLLPKYVIIPCPRKLYLCWLCVCKINYKT
jgi:hypothetical protein